MPSSAKISFSKTPISFVKQLKQQIVKSRYKIAKIANAESLQLYFTIGKIVEEQFALHQWGSKILDDISRQLQQELPGLRGFSGQNLRRMRVFFQTWQGSGLICSTVSSKLANSQTNNAEYEEQRLAFLSISFSHHYEIITNIKENAPRWYYIDKAAQDFWTVRQLRNELKNQSHIREQSLSNNFSKTLPDNMSNKAIRAFKDQYLLDFVNLEDSDDEIDEKILEQEIVQNIKKFMMSLGNDFSFMGNQYRLKVEEDEYFIDLLFFHRGLQSLVAFELKKGKFKPEYVGKMNFYLSALDDLIKQPHENTSIGIILCKEKDDKKVEYSFRDFNKPMGVSVFKTTEKLPQRFVDALPSPEQLKKLLDY